MKARVTRKEKHLNIVHAKIDQMEKVIMAILLRLEKLEEKK